MRACLSIYLRCADEGCRHHLCFQCVQRGVFANPNQEKLCPHCRRPAFTFSYAFFSAHKNVNALRERVSAAEVERTRLKKKLAIVKFDAVRAVQNINEWDKWAASSRSAVVAMPNEPRPSPVVVNPRTRSRSPRSEVRYVEYNG